MYLAWTAMSSWQKINVENYKGIKTVYIVWTLEYSLFIWRRSGLKKYVGSKVEKCLKIFRSSVSNTFMNRLCPANETFYRVEKKGRFITQSILLYVSRMNPAEYSLCTITKLILRNMKAKVLREMKGKSLYYRNLNSQSNRPNKYYNEHSFWHINDCASSPH